MALTDKKKTERTGGIEAFRARVRSGKRGSDHLYAVLLGFKSLETERLLKELEKGFPFRVVENLQRNLDIPMATIAEMAQIPERTLHRRKGKGHLEPAESDRLLRVSRIFAKAIELFEGNDATAKQWLSSPQRALGGAIPLALARTEFGALEVERLIGRLEHGVFT
jgi:putative toxin-antitoxin system antitoxin component (TIGR02293 family)